MKIAILTGEPSGDLLASEILKHIKTSQTDLKVIGIGGGLLEAQGVKSKFPLSELSVNGMVEVLPHLPRLLFRLEQTIRWLMREQPDLVLTVDAPDFTLRVAKSLRNRGFKGKLVHLVAPTVWAWKPERAAAIAPFLDHLLCLFPFEPPYFEAVGLKTTFVGHPIVERPVSEQAKDDNLLVLLPGSRVSEVTRMVPLFRETVALLAVKRPGLRCLVPTVETTRAKVLRTMSQWPTAIDFTFQQSDKQAAFDSASFGLAASGTVALELAQARVAGVMTYKLHPRTFRKVKEQASLDHFSLINILAEREIMPELLQDKAQPARLAKVLDELMEDSAPRQTQVRAQSKTLELLTLSGGQSAAKLAADTILKEMNNPL